MVGAAKWSSPTFIAVNPSEIAGVAKLGPQLHPLHPGGMPGGMSGGMSGGIILPPKETRYVDETAVAELRARGYAIPLGLPLRMPANATIDDVKNTAEMTFHQMEKVKPKRKK